MAVALTVHRKCSVVDAITSPTGGLDAQRSHVSPNVRHVSLEVFPVTPMPNRGPEARAVTG